MASFVDVIVDPIAHRKQQRTKLHALQRQLNRLNEEKRKLKHDLVSLNLDRLMTMGVNSSLRDLKRGIVVDAKQLKNEIGRQLPLVAEARRAQELLAAYQLIGCTTFIYKDAYLAIRLDTFYNRRYYEPYYLILDGAMIRWTTLPWFITSSPDVQEALLPDSLDVLVRAYQEALLGYIARREQIKEFQAKASETDNLEIKVNVALCNRLTIVHHLVKGASYHIELHYFNAGSMFPSNIKVVHKALQDKIDVYRDPYDVERIVNAFTTKKLLQAYQSVF